MNEIKLGLGVIPEPVILYVKLERDESGVYCWYEYNHDKGVSKFLYVIMH